MATTSQEALWVLRAQCGDSGAVESLLRAVQPSLRRYLAGLVGPADADDVLQEVLILVYRKLVWLHDPKLFRPWAFRIASRAGFRYLRKRRRWSEQVEERASVDDLPAAETSMTDGPILQLLAAHPVSPGSGAVLRLHFEEQMPLAEVAAILEIPLGTVKSRLAYGLAALRKRLSERRS